MKRLEYLDHITQVVQQALAEDIGAGDVTTNSIIPEDTKLEAVFVAKQDGVIAGLDVAQLVFSLLDEHSEFIATVRDGESVTVGQPIATVYGAGRAILSGERVALNLLQRMCGIAAKTQQFVQAIRGTKAIILDTRKTVPGLRYLDKWAVQIGGGLNHRFGLFDEVLIKDNHIAAAKSISDAVMRVRQSTQPQQYKIIVEVQTLDELQETLHLHVDRILLDNMPLEQMRQAVNLTNGQTPLEASGNMSLDNVAEVAATGVDFISVGALTHSVQAVDISLLINQWKTKHDR